jgi:hypothetical protein
MAIVTRAEIDSIIARLSTVEKTVEGHNTLFIVGNGEPAMKDQVRTLTQWKKDNELLPETVRTQGRWIQNINKLGWAIIVILLGILVTNGYGVFFKPTGP